MASTKVLLAVIAVALGIFVFYCMKDDVGEVPKIEDDKWWGEGDKKQESDEIRPFKYEATDAELADFQRRLKDTKYFKTLENSSWDYGTRNDVLKEVIEYWMNNFSWRKQEKIINSFKHFKTNIDGISLHFIHSKPSNVKPGTKVIPILLLHGWPGSFFEFYKVIPSLLQEQNGIVFEVIVPSLPGYGFSSPASKRGMSAVNMALIMKKLMHRLGHSTFYIQGGDFGSMVCRSMAILFPSVVRGAHLNFFPMPFHPKHPILVGIIGHFAPSLVVSDENKRKKLFPMWDHFKTTLEETGYMHIQATKPDTVGVGLINSPAGLASYMLEKFITVTSSRTEDALGTMGKRITLNELLTNIMIYWLTDTMPSAMRLYKETVPSKEFQMLDRLPIRVPVGFASFPEEGSPPPESWLKLLCKNLVTYTDMKRGGHFAAFEEPVDFTRDVRHFVEKVEETS